MDVKTFSEWLVRQGYQVYQTESSWWYTAGPRVLQAFPYGWLIQPSPRELRDLILRHNIMAVRYSTPLDAHEGMASYHVVLDDPAYGLEKLRSQARNGVRRGLANCQVERIPFARLAEEGWILQQDTLERQNRAKSMSQSEWQRICLSAADLPGFEAWGAIVAGELAATILTCRIDHICYVPYAQSLHKFLGQHVNNALFYTASRDMLAREGVSEIFFSLHSLDAPESVNEFKFRMSFTARPVRQRVVFHPLLRPLANRYSHELLDYFMKRDPANSSLAKAEGMLRFYLRGKVPLEQQPWPECLAEHGEKTSPPQSQKTPVAI
jgi:hypothetical protein